MPAASCVETQLARLNACQIRQRRRVGKVASAPGRDEAYVPAGEDDDHESGSRQGPTREENRHTSDQVCEADRHQRRRQVVSPSAEGVAPGPVAHATIDPGQQREADQQCPEPARVPAEPQQQAGKAHECDRSPREQAVVGGQQSLDPMRR